MFKQFVVPSRWIEADFVPLFDMAVSFEAKSVQVTMELPGVEKGNIRVSVLPNLIIVGGHKIIRVPINKDEIVHRGRQGGSFSRMFTVESTIKLSDIKWDLKDGIFTMTYPDARAVAPMQKGAWEGNKGGKGMPQDNDK